LDRGDRRWRRSLRRQLQPPDLHARQSHCPRRASPSHQLVDSGATSPRRPYRQTVDLTPRNSYSPSVWLVIARSFTGLDRRFLRSGSARIGSRRWILNRGTLRQASETASETRRFQLCPLPKIWSFSDASGPMASANRPPAVFDEHLDRTSRRHAAIVQVSA